MYNLATVLFRNNATSFAQHILRHYNVTMPSLRNTIFKPIWLAECLTKDADTISESCNVTRHLQQNYFVNQAYLLIDWLLKT